MKALSAALRELLGLFVEDGTLAVLLVAWVAAAAVLLPRLPLARAWDAPLLLAGCIAILVENVARASRRR